MNAPRDLGNRSPQHVSDPDIDLAGYDPYIVAITAVADDQASNPLAKNMQETTESRKAQLMTWLREHGA